MIKSILILAISLVSGSLFASCNNNGVNAAPQASTNQRSNDFNEKNTDKNNKGTNAIAINKVWKKHVEFEGMNTSPEEYIFKDIDHDGIAEVIVRGGGFNAIFTNLNGELSLIAKSFGEFESLSITEDGFVCLLQESGRSADLFKRTYFHIKKSKIHTILCHSVDCYDDDEENTYTTYTLTKGTKETKEISEKQSINYMPSFEERPINSLTKWTKLQR